VGDGDGVGVGVGFGVGVGDGVGVGVGVGLGEPVPGEDDEDVLLTVPQPARSNKAQAMPEKMQTWKPGRKLRFIVVPPGRTGRLCGQLLWLHPAHTYLLEGKNLCAPSRDFEQARGDLLRKPVEVASAENAANSGTIRNLDPRPENE
jgi:hypothetical protein